jgi:DNA invertase Pin-like site-specific DNA recombinase
VNPTAKISSSHLSRLAIVYVRQSTVAQVRFNTESTQRQYGLVGTAAEFGWLAEQIVVVDADLGVSGRFGAERDGYRQIVARMCIGEVGAVFGLEVSRFGRSNADLTRLMELARLTDTLLIDTDGVYDLANVNDRILLGLKGQMSEIELHFLLGRLHGAKLAAAQRGELRHPLPVGFVYDYDHMVVKDPDEQVQRAVTDLFAEFDRTGSALGVVRAFADTGRLFPQRAWGGAWAGQLKWGKLTHARVLQALKNPTYAGAYTFGKTRDVRRVQPDGSVRSARRKRAREEVSRPEISHSVAICRTPMSFVRSPQNREHEMGDPVALDADRRVAEQDVFRGEFAEEGSVSRAHHHRHQVDGHLVQQPEVQALPGDGSPGDGDDRIAGEFLGPCDRGLHPVGDEGERRVGVGVDPVLRDPVRHHDNRDVQGVPAPPAVRHVEQRPTTDERTQRGHPPPPVLRTRRGEVDGEVPGRGRDRDLAVL